MSDKSSTRAAPDDGAAEQARVKEKYLKPAFRHEKVFETIALACGTISSVQAPCRFNMKNS